MTTEIPAAAPQTAAPIVHQWQTVNVTDGGGVKTIDTINHTATYPGAPIVNTAATEPVSRIATGNDLIAATAHIRPVEFTTAADGATHSGFLVGTQKGDVLTTIQNGRFEAVKEHARYATPDGGVAEVYSVKPEAPNMSATSAAPMFSDPSATNPSFAAKYALKSGGERTFP